jgi:putative oxidoreductase
MIPPPFWIVLAISLADPYTFLLASLLILIFGAGFFSLDVAILNRWRTRA